MRRRAVLSVLGTVSALGVTDLHLISESVRSGLLSALGLDDWQEIADEAGRQFMTAPAAASRTQLAGDLILLRQAITESDSVTLRLTAPRLMTLYGIATANTGDISGAARMYRGARLAADDTRDDRLRRWVRGREAFRRGYEGADPSEVLTTAHGVDEAEAYLAAAQAYARLGQRSNALASVESAQRSYASADKSEGTIYAVQPWRYALSVAYVYALLGDVQRAEEQTRQVQPPANMVRWRAQLNMQNAVLIAKAGDRAAAKEAADDVLKRLPSDQRSTLVVEMWKEVARSA